MNVFCLITNRNAVTQSILGKFQGKFSEQKRDSENVQMVKNISIILGCRSKSFLVCNHKISQTPRNLLHELLFDFLVVILAGDFLTYGVG